MTQPQPPPPAGGKTYFALQDPDDPQPYAVAALNADGMPERFVPGKGFIDWPPLTGALHGFDAEAAREVKPITEEQANALTAQNIGALPDAYVAANQGTPEGNSQAEPVDPDAGV
jgi:hypothetical protein